VGFLQQLISKFRPRVAPQAPAPVRPAPPAARGAPAQGAPASSRPVEPTAATPGAATAATPSIDAAAAQREREQAEILASFQHGIVDPRFLELDVDRRFVEQFDLSVSAGRLELVLPPAAAFDVMRMVDSPNYPVKKVAGAISCEPALAGAVLTLANSPLHRGSVPVESLNDAIVRLGQRQLRLLLLELALHATRVKGRPFEEFSEMTWKHSLLAAQLAFEIGGAAKLDPEQAYMAGLFHDVGVLTVLGAARQLALKERRSVSKQTVLKLIFGHTANFNLHVMQRWSLPAPVAAAVLHRDAPEVAGDDAPLAATTRLANDLCRHHGAWAPQRPVDLAEHPALRLLKIGPERLPRRDEVLAMAWKVERVAQLH
jgi:HD-like signal output (HDOD) protein